MQRAEHEPGRDQRAFGTLQPLWNFMEMTPDAGPDWNVGNERKLRRLSQPPLTPSIFFKEEVKNGETEAMAVLSVQMELI